MSNAAGLAWSPDGRSVLISSDKTGVFNAYALPVAGGAPVALTASTTVATFAESAISRTTTASWSPPTAAAAAAS